MVVVGGRLGRFSLSRGTHWRIGVSGGDSDADRRHNKSYVMAVVDRRTQVEASSRAEFEDIVSFANSILYTAITPVVVSMKQKQPGNATEKKDAAKALDKLLLMDEVW